MAGASATMGVALIAIRPVLFGAGLSDGPVHGLTRLLALGGLIGTGIAVYAAAAQAFGAYDLRDVVQMMLRRRLRRGGGSVISAAPTIET
jgi:hypothetical protein